MSCSVAKHALPITRFSIMRPATATAIVPRLQRRVVLRVMRGVQFARERVAPEIVRIGAACRAQRGKLGSALGNDLVLVGEASARS